MHTDFIIELLFNNELYNFLKTQLTGLGVNECRIILDNILKQPIENDEQGVLLQFPNGERLNDKDNLK